MCFSSSSVLFSEIWIGVETLELNQPKVTAEANAWETQQNNMTTTFGDNMLYHSKYTHLVFVFDFIFTRIISEWLNFNRFYVFNTKEFALVPDCYISEVASFANISQSDSVMVQFLSLLNQNLVFENEYGISVGERRFGTSCNTKQRQVMTTTGVKGASLSEL